MEERPVQDYTVRSQESREGEPLFVPTPSHPPYEILRQRERSRRWIAAGLTGLIIVVVLLFVIRVLFIPSALDAASVDAFKTILAIVAAIYGSIIGFFFGAGRE